jgi:ATP-dependent exoDNAse (exonuclease V) alpha subunit
MENKFKVGDTVKIIENESGSRNKVGDIGIIKYANKTNYSVDVEGREIGSTGDLHVESDLELVNSEPTYEIY